MKQYRKETKLESIVYQVIITLTLIALPVFGHAAQTEKGGVCAVVYPIKGLTKLAKDVPYLTWHVFCSIT